MKKKSKYFWLAAVTLIAALLMSGTVFAEGEDVPEAPAAPAGTAESPPPEEQPAVEAPVEEPIVEEPVAVEEPLEAADPAPEVTLVDTDGQPLDGASRSSADTLAVADPYFSTGDGAQYYRFLPIAGACAAYPGDICFDGLPNPIQAAIDYVSTTGTIPDYGKIYVESGTYGGPVTIDGYLDHMNSLTGLFGDPTSGTYPVINSTVTLINLTNGFTLDGFTIKGGVVVKDSSGQFVFENLTANISMTDVDASGNTGSGITFNNNKGSITLTHVTASGNDNIGVWVNNHAGHVYFTDVTASDNGENGAGIFNDTGKYNITIKNSEFNHNGLNSGVSGSLSIWSNGVVTLNGVIANGSNENYGGTGIHVRSGGATLRNIIADNNGEHGIYVELRSGSLLLENAIARNNGADGVKVELRDKDGKEIAYPANVTMKNVTSNENGGNGIYVAKVSNVTMTTVNTERNNENGVHIQASGKVLLSHLESGENGWNGLLVEGIYLYDELYNVVGMISPSMVTITSPRDASRMNAFWNNGQQNDWDKGTHGMYIISQRNVSISNFGLYGHENGYGLYVKGPDLYDSDPLRSGAVTINCTVRRNRNAAHGNQVGVWVKSASNVSLSKLESSESGQHAVFVDALGAIRLSDMSDWGNRTIKSVILLNLQALKPMPVTITNLDINETRNESDDWGAALDVHSLGAITVNGLNMGGNQGMGAALGNDFEYAKGNITLSNISVNDCQQGGLQAFSSGAILLNNVWVNNNWDFGVYLTNSGVPKAMAVTLTNCDISRNGGLGLEVLSLGTITARNVSTNENGNGGARLDNCLSDDFGTCTGSGRVALTNFSADNNGDTGLSISTNSQAVLNGIYTHNNAKTFGWTESGRTVQDYLNSWSHGQDHWGFTLEHDQSYTIRMQADVIAGSVWPDGLNRVPLTGLGIEFFDWNDPENSITSMTMDCGDGYCQFTYTPEDDGYTEAHEFFVRLSADNEGFYHFSINDATPTDASTDMYWVDGVKIVPFGGLSVNEVHIHNNSLSGLGAYAPDSSGKIALSNINISGNGIEGLSIKSGSGAVSMAGGNDINSNGWAGFTVQTSGAVLISQLGTHNNGHAVGGRGLTIGEDSTPSAVTLRNVSVNDNASGLWATASGNISLSGVDVSNNGWSDWALYLDNCLEGSSGCTGTGAITLQNVNAGNNASNGIQALSGGLIRLTGVDANNNFGGAGIHLKNQFESATAGIGLTGVTANSNNANGIEIFTNGALALRDITASDNAKRGGGIEPGYTKQDFYNQNKGPDQWWFGAEANTTYTFELLADGYSGSDLLNRANFDPFIELWWVERDEWGGEEHVELDIQSLASYTCVTNESCQVSFNLFDDFDMDFDGVNWIYMAVGSTIGDGFYRLSLDDPDQGEIEEFYVNGLFFDAGGSVTMSGVNEFGWNSLAGLAGFSGGNVALASVDANGNGAEGIYVDNTASVGSVTLAGNNRTSWNGWEGLRVVTGGAVSISNLDASYNNRSDETGDPGDGLRAAVRVEANGLGQPVTLTNVSAMNNQGTGLLLLTNGLTTLNNVNAWLNGVDGADVNTNGNSLTVMNSSFMCNAEYGLEYWKPSDPSVFTDLNNTYLGNGSGNLEINYP